MRDLSSVSNYTTIYNSGNYHTECKLRIYSGTSHTDVGEDKLKSMTTSVVLFENTPTIGNCVAGKLEVSFLYNDDVTIPKMAKMAIMCRLVSNSSNLVSGWVQKGIYYVDTRSSDVNRYGDSVMNLTAYDVMLKAESDCVLQGGLGVLTAVQQIATAIGCPNIDSRNGVDARTTAFLSDKEYVLPSPTGYTMREALSYIASRYSGNFAVNDFGELRLIRLPDQLVETRLLMADTTSALIMGQEDGEDVRILI